MSKETEERVQVYIASHNGSSTKLDVVAHMHKILSKPTVLKLLDKLESEGKIRVSRGRKRGQPHLLCTNDKNKFNQIKEELSGIEMFIKKTKPRLKRWSQENFEAVQLRRDEDESVQRMLGKRIDLVNYLESLHNNAIDRILNNLYILVAHSYLSGDDSEWLLAKITELKARLTFLDWSKDAERSTFTSYEKNIQNIIRIFETTGLEDYIKSHAIKETLCKPLTEKIKNFKGRFLA